MKTKALAWPDPVRTLILSEPDQIPVVDFLALVGVWEKTLTITVVK
jgi:hypothetical protein